MIPWWLSSKEPTANAGDAVGSLSQEEAQEKEMQPSPVLMPGNHMGRGAEEASVHVVTKSQIQPRD